MVQSLQPMPDKMDGTMGTKPFLKATLGNTTYTFALTGQVEVHTKRLNGAIIQQTGRTLNENVLDSPWHLATLLGLGISKADLEYGKDAENRIFSSENINTLFPGLYCLGPSKRTTTLPAGVSNVTFTGFLHSMSTLYAYGTGTATGATSDQALLYYDGTNWADTTAKSGIAGAGGSGTMIVTSGCQHLGRTYIALRGTLTNNAAATVKIARSNVASSTVWVDFSTSASANPISGSPYGLVSIADVSASTLVLWVADYNGSGTIAVKTSGDDGATWATTWATIYSGSAPRGAVSFLGHSNTQPLYHYWLGTAERLHQMDPLAGTYRDIIRYEFKHPESAYTGQLLRTPRGLIMTDGPNVLLGTWEGIATGAAFKIENLGPGSKDDGLPALKRGDVTGVSYDGERDWLIAAIGGQDASHNSGVYIYRFQDASWHNLYYGSANTIINAVESGTETAGTPNLHMSEGATALYRFQDFTRDPRLVSGYSHGAAGKLVLPKQDRGLPAFPGIWRKISFAGSNWSATEKVSAVYAVADGLIIDTDGTWGTTLGSVTANLGNVNFPGTPTGTGQSAYAMQVRIDLAGSSNKSPYVESTDIYVKKLPSPKYVRVFTIDVDETAKLGTSSTRADVMANLETLVTAATDVVVSWGDRVNAVTMEPYHYAGFGWEPEINYLSGAEMAGTSDTAREIPLLVKIAFVEV